MHSFNELRPKFTHKLDFLNLLPVFDESVLSFPQYFWARSLRNTVGFFRASANTCKVAKEPFLCFQIKSILYACSDTFLLLSSLILSTSSSSLSARASFFQLLDKSKARLIRQFVETVSIFLKTTRITHWLPLNCGSWRTFTRVSRLSNKGAVKQNGGRCCPYKWHATHH